MTKTHDPLDLLADAVPSEGKASHPDRVPSQDAGEGRVETIALTPGASRQARHLLATTEAYAGLPLRLYIEGKGCDGFYYGVNFDKAEADDLHFTIDGVACIVDPRTYLFCKG